MTYSDEKADKFAADEDFYRSLPDSEMREEMLRCLEVERAYESNERPKNPAPPKPRKRWWQR